MPLYIRRLTVSSFSDPQIRSHAQKYFAKLAKGESSISDEVVIARHPSTIGRMPAAVAAQLPLAQVQKLQSELHAKESKKHTCGSSQLPSLMY